MRLAREAELDLVEVAPMARPPVVKLMDYGKFKYENAQKAREPTPPNQHSDQGNEAAAEDRQRLRDQEGSRRTLPESRRQGQDHDHVPGREQSRPELGYNLLKGWHLDVDEYGYVESSPKQDGRNMLMVLGPLKKKTEARAEAKAERIVAPPSGWPTQRPSERSRPIVGRRPPLNRWRRSVADRPTTARSDMT